jgi:predicted transcriptional regulator
MPRKSSTTPTEGELAILRVLWHAGPQTVRDVHNALAHERKEETGYSTTLKMMQVMMEKGLLLRDESVRPQVYRAAEPQQKTQLKLLDSLIQKGFGGSAMRLVLRAVSAKRITRDELAQIKKLLEKGKADDNA